MNLLEFDQVRSIATVADLITPIAQKFLNPPQAPDRLHYKVGVGVEDPATLLVMPAWGDGLIGIKLIGAFPGNAANGMPTIQGVYVLLSQSTGEPLLVIDGRALTFLRTAAVSAFAADLLVSANPRRLLMVGTGALVPYLIEGHCSVRRYQSVSIWGRDRRKATALADSLSSPGHTIEAAADLESAVREADVISCATLSQRPLLRGEWLKPGSHVDLVGSFTPAMREADDVAVARARIVADSTDAMHTCGDLCEPLKKCVITARDIQILGGLPVPSNGDITLFKSVGTAVADLAAAAWIYGRFRGET